MKTSSILGISLLLFTAGCHNSKSNANSSPHMTAADSAAERAKTATPFSPAVPIAETFDEAKARGVILKNLDNVYMDAINVSDSGKAAFKGQTMQVAGAFRQMLGDFVTQLKNNKSFENKVFRYYCRVYFRADGTVDYYFYNQMIGLNPDEEVIFKKSLNEFIKTYKFPMKAKVPFAQCAPVIIQPRNI
jgi:hypothetical protein